MNKDNFKNFFIKFWERSYDFSQFCFLEKVLFYFLVFLEKIYCSIFFINKIYKKIFKKKYKYNFKIISVGNISAGGTGKSVLVQYLIKNLCAYKKCAVISHGYKSKIEKTGKSFLLDHNSLNKNNFSPIDVGDEAFMLTKNLDVPVVVGKNRVKSCELLKNIFKYNLDIAILDDGYQKFEIKKDCEILLLDARHPLENGHCLPAGKLREKDYSRADIIILTHADLLSFKELEDTKNLLALNFCEHNIVYAKHSFDGLYLKNKEFIDHEKIINNKILLFAGIGDFSSFKNSIINLGFKNIVLKEFIDHQEYLENNIKDLINLFNKNNCDALITTEKDWVKISEYFNLQEFFAIKIYVLKIKFEFIFDTEKIFLTELKNKIL